jgi:dTDP-4-amino-4,6-dideoxygalactose transaminase
MYPGTLLAIPELRPHLSNPDAPCPGATEVAARLFTLPVSPGLGPSDVDAIASAVRREIG